MRSDEQGPGPVIRDRRRIDPVTGQVRDPFAAEGRAGAGEAQRQGQSVSRPGPGQASRGTPDAGPAAAQAAEATAAGGEPTAATGGPGPDEALAKVEALLAERTADLQRLQAEYANYRKRVERDRLAVREQAVANVLAELLPVLDDIGRARGHGELTGGFKSVAESLEASAGKLGLVSFGEPGEPFDPKLHEALMHSYSDEVTEVTSAQVLLPGYRVGDRIIRPARVAVAEPAQREPTAGAESEPAEAEAVTEPGGTEPGVTEPGVTEPEATEPQSAESRMSDAETPRPTADQDAGGQPDAPPQAQLPREASR